MQPLSPILPVEYPIRSKSSGTRAFPTSYQTRPDWKHILEPRASQRRSPAETSQETDIRSCPRILREALCQTSDRDRTLLLCAVSCVLGSNQQMSVDALRGAVMLYAWNLDECPMPLSLGIFRQWLGNFARIFRVNHSDLVAFAIPAMAQFLRTFPARGLDASQRTIAMLCLAQVQLDSKHDCREELSRQSSIGFSQYARDNSHYHEQTAARCSLSLSLQGSRRRRTKRNSPSRKATANTYNTAGAERRKTGWNRDVLISRDCAVSEDWDLIEASEAL